VSACVQLSLAVNVAVVPNVYSRTDCDLVVAEYGQYYPLLDLLPATADELVRRTGRPAAAIAQALVELELGGAVSAHDGIYRVQ